MTRLVRWSAAIYSRLLYVCPEELRRDFGPEMTLVFTDDLTDSWQEAGMPGFVRAWRCAAVDLLQTGAPAAFRAPAILVPLLCCGATAICFGGELMLARAHSPIGSNPPILDAIRTVVILPSLAAALVSSTAVFVSARNTCRPFLRGSSERS